jgi:hypothetical protein
MFQAVKSQLRHWGFLLLKLIGAGIGSTAALWFLNLFWWPETPLFSWNRVQFCYDLLYTTLAGVWFLFSYGLFYLAIWDQKYRCRTCQRRLVMPVETGSWGFMLQLGRPRIEYICPYGHGTLNVEELQISGKVQPQWTKHGDIWAELFAAGKDSDRER